MVPPAAAASPPAAPPPSSAVPKPFKKRYLAEQSVIVTSSHNNHGGVVGNSASPSPNSTTPTPSATPTPPVSPMASDTVRACEALLELGRPLEEGGGGKEEVVPRNGACYPASGPKNGDHLLQAVWKGVVGTLLSQQVGSYGKKYPKYLEVIHYQGPYLHGLGNTVQLDRS
jgi:hypothetical protein